MSTGAFLPPNMAGPPPHGGHGTQKALSASEKVLQQTAERLKELDKNLVVRIRTLSSEGAGGPGRTRPPVFAECKEEQGPG